MQWQDRGIIISIRKLGESSLIASVLTRNYGLHHGVIKYAKNKANKAACQLGNIVDATWKARLSEHLGTFTFELVESSAWIITESPLKLASMLSSFSVIEKCLPEREPHPEVFDAFKGFMEVMKQGGEWLGKYVAFEMELLSRAGFGLDLEACAVTGVKENLAFVSPRTGRAVTEEGAGQYKEKLLKLPDFMVSGNNLCPKIAEILDGLKLTGYFLLNHIFLHKGIKSIPYRDRLVEMLEAEMLEIA